MDFTLSTSAIPVGSSVTVRFYGKGVTSGYGHLEVNNSEVDFNTTCSSYSRYWGATSSSTGSCVDGNWYQYTYSFTTGPGSTNTFKWKYYTNNNGQGVIDNIEIVW